MSRTRPERRIDYRNFPQPYFDALDVFLARGSWQSPLMEYRKALALRSNLYRFFGFLRNAPRIEAEAVATLGRLGGKVPPEAVGMYDEVAARYTGISSAIKMRVVSAPNERNEAWVVFELDPLVTIESLQKEYT